MRNVANKSFCSQQIMTHVRLADISKHSTSKPTFLVPSAKFEGAGRPSRLWMVAVLPVPAMPMQRMVAVNGSSSGGPCSASWRSASAKATSKGLRLGPPLLGTRMLSARSSLHGTCDRYRTRCALWRRIITWDSQWHICMTELRRLQDGIGRQGIILSGGGLPHL